MTAKAKSCCIHAQRDLDEWLNMITAPSFMRIRPILSAGIKQRRLRKPETDRDKG